MHLQTAWNIAHRLAGRLARVCDRVAIAGSVRRLKPDVGDIEIVAIPTMDRDLFGQPADTGRLPLDHLLDQLAWPRPKNGPRYKQLIHPDGINIDLFLVRPPAQWGVIYALRTGPADYSHWLVTPRYHGGALPAGYSIHEGGLYRGPQLLPTPEEADLFRLLGIPDLAPPHRARPQPGRPDSAPNNSDSAPNQP